MRVHGPERPFSNLEKKEYPMPKTQYVDFKAVKQAVSILQILDHYNLTGRFKRNGDSLTGPCPLHNGQSPTQFRVSISKNCWNCFSECKSGGNILDFVARKEDVSIREAALRIAGWFNLSFEKPIPNDEARPAEKAAPPETNPAKPSATKPEVESGANKPLGFQLQNLDAAHPYLTERGLTSETVAEFGLGLCNKGSMTGHVVIPIHNAEGQLVAYAGRWPGTPPEDQPKYKLPPGFKKSLELFNLHRAIQSDGSQSLVIVEGFFGCVKLHQHGCRKVVALMGSSLSAAQEELIRKHTNTNSHVIVMLDEDEAGQAGREDIACRLSRFCFVKVHQFNKPGAQPEHLSAEEVQELIGGGL